MSTITRLGTHSPPMDDSQLASQARTDTEAFAELYRRHLTRVFRYHMARTGDVKEAEDLTSQTFMAALESIRSFRNDGTFAAWILGIAMRKQALFFRGHNRDNLRVYRHAGEPCACCGAPIERTVVGGRGTHFCPHCQK